MELDREGESGEPPLGGAILFIIDLEPRTALYLKSSYEYDNG